MELESFSIIMKEGCFLDVVLKMTFFISINNESYYTSKITNIKESLDLKINEAFILEWEIVLG